MKTDYHFLPHEYEHLKYLKEHAYECTLFLKREDESFPLESPCKITLIGNGVRHTVIGGTGSGAVNVKYEENIEEAFKNAGFEITTDKWLSDYDKETKEADKAFVKQVKKEARQNKAIAASYSLGRCAPEREYEFPIIGDHEVAIYVLSRNAGEGADRELIKGSVYLTDTEIRDILYLNNNYKKFLLVLNTPSVIDLEPVLEVKNILLLSQLGSSTGDILVDIVLGKVNPCGKLTDTWAKIKDYPYINTPIDFHETRYNEGIYVGYRYFESKGIEPVFEFGFGESYTKFTYHLIDAKKNKDKFNLKVKVTNSGNYPGKEVIQLYMTGPSFRAGLELVAFKKTCLLKPKESEELELEFSLRDFPSYSESKEAYYLNQGLYIFKLGNSSRKHKDVFAVNLKEELLLRKVKNVFKKTDFDDLRIDRVENKLKESLPLFELTKEDIGFIEVQYKDTYEVEIPEYIKSLSDLQLIHLVLGDYKVGLDGIIGQSCSTVLGGAGETTLRVEGMDLFANMVDGPAGLRIIREYVVNKNGSFPTTPDSISEVLQKYLPWPIASMLSYRRNLKKKGSKVVQIATAIPIATALAQSFNEEFIYGCGRLVREEMEMYDVDIWLAPGMNIHRNILCGRNFEYYSEDPLVTAFTASQIVKAVEENPSKATTVKHYACNNQETNRLNNNSIISERAAREIYLSSFERVIKSVHPRAIMTSYNLVNGYHSSEHKGLIIDLLRNEWGYKGLVMTDWVASGQAYRKGNKYPAAYASRNIKNGNNINMPGNKADIKDIKKALKSGYLSRHELENAAAIVYNFVCALKGKAEK